MGPVGSSAKQIATTAGGFLGGPVGGILGNIVGGLFGRSGQNSANEANLRIARENREWQERMSNSAYQRSAADLEKAGLNRILSIGQPASTPAGNIATMQNKNAKLADAIGQSVQTAMQAKKLNQEIKESDSRIFLNNTTAQKNTAGAGLADNQAIESATRTAGIRTANEIAKLNKQITLMNIEGVRNQYEFARWLQTSDNNLLYQKLKAASPITKDFAQAIGTITGAFNLKNLLGGKNRPPYRPDKITTNWGPGGQFRSGSTTTYGN
jgi:hypothetical protein